jgi:hypothetical protein
LLVRTFLLSFRSRGWTQRISYPRRLWEVAEFHLPCQFGKYDSTPDQDVNKVGRMLTAEAAFFLCATDKANCLPVARTPAEAHRLANYAD